MSDQPNSPHTSKHSFTLYPLFVIIFLIVLIPLWLFLIAPELKKIPDDFSYSANILSLDNFYDEGAQKFEGEHISKTMFSYSVVANHKTWLDIKNQFSVFTLSNKPIFSVARDYFIDPYNGQHVIVQDEEKRQGYLFAPHYATKNGFTYWHINYDAPANMKFVDQESIDGLTIYHYKAHYQADQTMNLTRLPGVPEKRGIKTDVILQLWIEPVTGWLVKYQDNTLASYYDRKTGKILTPWNKFSNRYTQNSIQEQVEIAKKLKIKFLLIDFVIPILLTSLIVIILCRYYLFATTSHYRLSVKIFFRYKTSSYIIYVILLGCTLIPLILLYDNRNYNTVYTIGISQWNDNPELVTAIHGFKDGLTEYGFQEGKNIRYILKNPDASIENQINIIQSFVHNNVNVIFTLTTPGTLVAKGITTQIPIVFSDVIYPEESNLISTTSTTNLVGTRNYIAPAEQYYEFESLFPDTKILGFVHRKGDPDSEIQFEEYKNLLNERNIAIIDIAAIDLDDLQKKLVAALQQNHFNALFVACDTLIRDGGGKIAADFSERNKIPSFTCDKASVNEGVLVGYFADLYSIGKIAGKKTALLLRGAEPEWLHTITPKQGYLIINLITAKKLGITVPNEELMNASEVIK